MSYTLHNPGPDGWHIPAFGVMLAPGESVVLPGDDPATVGHGSIEPSELVESVEAATPEQEQA